MPRAAQPQEPWQTERRASKVDWETSWILGVIFPSGQLLPLTEELDKVVGRMKSAEYPPQNLHIAYLIAFYNGFVSVGCLKTQDTLQNTVMT